MRKIKKSKKQGSLRVQMRGGDAHPFTELSYYVPLKNSEMRLYREIREAVPIIDAAIVKLIRLTGGFSVHCRDKSEEAALARFLKNVDTGRGQRGIDSFLNGYLDSMITCGRAFGEIVLRDRREIAAILCGDAEKLEVREGETPLDFTICAFKNGKVEPLAYQQLLMMTPYNPEAGSPYGTSLLRSMPFLTDILMTIYKTVGSNWERSGNVRYAVVYKPSGDILDKAYARERSEQIAHEWSDAMASGKHGAVRDFVAVGDVDIKVIGAESQILDSEIPVRQILEQLIARTGIPPFMLGLNWSSIERMSSQQADILTSELTAIRRSLEPALSKIIDMWFALRGKSPDYEIECDTINLQDEVEEAHAMLFRAQSEKIMEELNEKNERSGDPRVIRNNTAGA